MIQRLVCPHLSVMLLVKSEVLRPVNGFPVSLSGRYSTDYYDFAALSVTLAINQPTPKGVAFSSGVARIAIYPLT
jgi:hypothetical protein